MSKVIERFNMYDLFTMLIPGVIISTLLGISLAFEYYCIWKDWGNEKYVVFFILSYFLGIFLNELGAYVDKKLLYSFLYGGNPREIYLLECKYKNIFNEELFYKQALYIKRYFIKKLHIKNTEKMCIQDKKDLNSLIFGYCLNIAENNNLAVKSEKMLVISEMSRSLFLGCVFTIILNLYMIFQYANYDTFYYIETIILFLMALIFLYRKKRYEIYRIRILFRSFFLYIKSNK